MLLSSAPAARTQGGAAAEPAAVDAGAAAAAAIAASWSAHANPGAEQPVVNGNPGVHGAEAAAGGNPGHGDHSNPGAHPWLSKFAWH